MPSGISSKRPDVLLGAPGRTFITHTTHTDTHKHTELSDTMELLATELPTIPTCIVGQVAPMPGAAVESDS